MKKILLTAIAFGMASVCLQAKPKAKSEKFAGYLFTYFEGGGEGKLQEHLRFAISEDAQNWYALNENQPVIASDSISTSGGIRDPHILRGEDGCYYIVATDMNTVKNGWTENPGIVMLKSKDLVNWTHSKIVLGKDWPAFSDAYWVWAPQTIYDRKAKKYMIYFTLQRTGDGRKSLITYYAYANKDFTAFESEPKQLFSAKYGSIDNDIIYRDGKYHLFYKGNIKDKDGKELKNGIQQATSKSLKGPWKEDFKFLDAYADSRTGVEGSGVFKLNDREEYILMYDLFGSGRYEFQRSKDLTTFTEKPESFRKNFFPRHGTVCSVTADELDRLQQKWGYVLTTAEGVKTINVIGDSYVQNHLRPFQESWHYLLAQQMGMKYNNYGKNGACVAFDRSHDGKYNFGPAVYTKTKQMDPDADYVIVVAGHNDAYKVGNSKDSLRMFQDSLQLMIRNIQRDCPKAKIGYVTPWYVDVEGFSQVCKVIRKVCKKNNIPVLDNYSPDCVIKVRDEEFRKKYFQGPNDNAHLNASGHELFLQVAKKWFSSVMRPSHQ